MQYFYWKAPTQDLAKFNRALHFWIGYYNTDRLHGGLGYLTPMEKLHERREALKHTPSQPLPPELEKLRLKFIADEPKKTDKQDRQIQALETELRALLKIAA